MPRHCVHLVHAMIGGQGGLASLFLGSTQIVLDPRVDGSREQYAYSYESCRMREAQEAQGRMMNAEEQGRVARKICVFPFKA
jgi:hypothetical protein